MDIVNAIVALAERLSQGGVVLILVVFCGIMMYAVASMFKYTTRNNDKVVDALTATAKTIEANTQMGEQATKQSEANRQAIEGLTKAFIERRGR